MVTSDVVVDIGIDEVDTDCSVVVVSETVSPTVVEVAEDATTC